MCVSASGYARSGQILLWDQVGSEYLLGATEKRSGTTHAWPDAVISAQVQI